MLMYALDFSDKTTISFVGYRAGMRRWYMDSNADTLHLSVVSPFHLKYQWISGDTTAVIVLVSEPLILFWILWMTVCCIHLSMLAFYDGLSTSSAQQR